MLRERVLVTVIVLPLGLVVIALGGVFYTGLIAILLGLAVWEFAQLFHRGGHQPATGLMVAGVALLAFGRQFTSLNLLDNDPGFGWDTQTIPLVVSLCVLALTGYHMLAFERGRDRGASDLAVSLAGVFYIGWLGSYLIALRNLPEGVFWFLIALPTVWIADSGAYFIGKTWGRTKLSPRLPRKRGGLREKRGIPSGILGAVLLALLYGLFGSRIPVGQAAILGTVVAILAPWGDLGQSLFKRQFGVKDSSNLIPGRGGFVDRIDSWLWAGVISYYVIVLFFFP